MPTKDFGWGSVVVGLLILFGTLGLFGLSDMLVKESYQTHRINAKKAPDERKWEEILDGNGFPLPKSPTIASK